MYSLQTPVSLFLSCSVWAAWSSCVVTLLKSVACPPCHHHQRHTYILPTWEGNEGNQPLKRCTFCKPMAKHSHWMPLGHTHRYHCLKLYVPVDPTPTSSRFSYSLHGKWKHTQPPPPLKIENQRLEAWKWEDKMWKWVSFFIWRWISDSSRYCGTSSFGGDWSECHAACHELPKTADLADRTSEGFSTNFSEPDVAN